MRGTLWDRRYFPRMIPQPPSHPTPFRSDLNPTPGSPPDSLGLGGEFTKKHSLPSALSMARVWKGLCDARVALQDIAIICRLSPHIILARVPSTTLVLWPYDSYFYSLTKSCSGLLTPNFEHCLKAHFEPHELCDIPEHLDHQ
jgi:hypothetical protein